MDLGAQLLRLFAGPTFWEAVQAWKAHTSCDVDSKKRRIVREVRDWARGQAHVVQLYMLWHQLRVNFGSYG